jgi:hypothetical protein
MVEKVDFKKELAQLYAPKNKEWQLSEVPIMCLRLSAQPQNVPMARSPQLG